MEGFYYHGEIEHITEILKNRLYFAVLESEESINLQSSLDTHYFCTDDDFIYLNFYHDFGPLNISCVYKYCCKLKQFLNNTLQGVQRYVHYTANNPSKKTNAAFLIGCYAILYLNMEPKEAYQRLYSAGGSFKSYVDASQGPSPYTISIMDCFRAIKKCSTLNFFSFNDFNVLEYDNQDKLSNGDMNWLVPRKFLAFIGPTEQPNNTQDCFNGHPPVFYLHYFSNNDIRTVIRLNNKVYNEAVFTHVGIEHHDLFFPDGTIPPKHILLKFLDISEHSPAAIAVHCKAGLGRTGSLIGSYIVKHYHLTAREAIAWMRICRPGSVIGPQQEWLEKIEKWLWRQGSQYRNRHYGEGDKIPHFKYGIYSIQWQIEREKITRELHRQQEKELKKRDNMKRRSISELYQQNISLQAKALTPRQSYERKKMLLTQKEEELKRLSSILYNVQNRQKMSRDVEKEINEVIKPAVMSNERQARSAVDSRQREIRRSRTASSKRMDRDGDTFPGYAEQFKTRITTALIPKRSTFNKTDVNLIHDSPLSVSNNITSGRKTYTQRDEPEIKISGTQGDKLNEIKIKRFLEKAVNDERQKRVQRITGEKSTDFTDTSRHLKSGLHMFKKIQMHNQRHIHPEARV